MGLDFLDPIERGFAPDYTIADGAKGLRAGQTIVMPDTPCHGDVFHIQHQFEQVANALNRKASGATTQRLKLEARLKTLKARPVHYGANSSMLNSGNTD